MGILRGSISNNIIIFTILKNQQLCRILIRSN